jgi:hypothetical protein
LIDHRAIDFELAEAFVAEVFSALRKHFEGDAIEEMGLGVRGRVSMSRRQGRIRR